MIPADRRIIDEDLRHGPPSARAPHHLDAQILVGADIHLLEVETFADEELLRRAAIAAEIRGVENDARHFVCSIA